MTSGEHGEPRADATDDADVTWRMKGERATGVRTRKHRNERSE